ncbi:phosphatase PAP2 family protein [Streptomyces sp. NPDC058045]|uniref:phosphatase PAP2 family protein n=1 Tax=Streptomyces sp. NPDC058045 TaxID=3346311 RepID=UPI0036DFB884
MDSDLYLDITDFAHSTPTWVQQLGEVWTEAGLLLFGVLFVIGWWRSRREDAAAVALAVLAPVATAVALVLSEAVKSAVQEERPCRAVAGAPASLVECPPHGDWSFPSNHSVIAGGAAVALLLAWRGIGVLTLPMAVLMAFSRVFVGVHYPHDVLAGLVFGALLAMLAMRVLRGPVEKLVLAMRGSGSGAVRWCVGAGTPALPGQPAPGSVGYGAPDHRPEDRPSHRRTGNRRRAGRR